MILFLYGPDTYRSRQYLRQSIEQFKKQRDPQGYNTITLDAKAGESAKIVQELHASPFLAEKRMVVIENSLSSSDKDFLASMIDLVAEKKMPETTVALFWQGDPLSKVKEAKELDALLKKERFAQEFSLLTGSALAAWITNELKTLGAAANPDALAALGNQASDMWQLASTLHQLAAYCGKALITLADVQLFLEEKVDDNVFSLIDAIVGGNHKIAFKLLNAQRLLGEEDGKLFGLVLWQMRIILELADLLAREPDTTSDQAAKLLGVHPFVARKNFAIAKKHSFKKLTALYRELLDMDIKTKTGQAAPDMLLDLFVARV